MQKISSKKKIPCTGFKISEKGKNVISFLLVRAMATKGLSVDKISGVFWGNSHNFYMVRAIPLGNRQINHCEVIQIFRELF